MILCEGKYEFKKEPGGRLICLQYSEPWRDFVGDNAVLALFQYAAEMDDKLNKLKDLLDRVEKQLEGGR